MKYSAIIFDWDGTLGKTLHLWLKSYSDELQKLGFTYSDEVIIKDFFYKHEMTKAKYPELNFPDLLERVQDSISEHIPQLKLYDGVEETLKQLKESGLVLTLVSSSPRRLVKVAIEHMDLDKYFSALVAGDDVMMHKPHPEPFEKIIEIAKLNKAITLVLGDSQNDIVAAKAAGIHSCLFLPDENKLFYDFEYLKKSNPEYCMSTLKEFTDFVLDR